MNPISAYGASIAGIQAINGKIGASPRSRPRDSDRRRDSDNGEGTDAEPDAPQPHPPGVGSQIDKSA